MHAPNPSELSGGVLIQFAKWPEPGQVKTRLAADIGDEKALEAHLVLTTAVLHSLSATAYPLSFWWDRPRPPGVQVHADKLLTQLSHLAIPQFSQKGADLGARMAHALGTALENSPKAVIVGSDCPSVDPDYVNQAFGALAEADVVLGPSDDGGFVLIGTRCDLGDALTGIEWGTSRALEQTVQALTEAGFVVRQLAHRWDVDDVADWQRFLESRGS